MNADLSEILISEAVLQARIQELSAQISADYAGKDPILVCVLKGATLFFSDLFRNITVPCRCDFVGASSYGGGTATTGQVRLYQDVCERLQGQHVIVVEDIFDTGLTLDFLWKHLQEKEPASMRLCVLLDKPSRRNAGVKLQADYVGFSIPNAFVVGYGLDYDQHYRNLPYIGVLAPKIYQK